MKPGHPAVPRRDVLAGIGTAALLAGAPLRPAAASARSTQPLSIRVGYQYGLVYAPVLLMRRLGTVRNYLPDASIEFSQVASGPVVRDQLIARRLDIGVLGPPPFQIGWQHLNWKYIASTGVFPYRLVTWREDIRSIADFRPEDKIAVPGPGSLQHILLAMAAKTQLGNARALDANIVPLPHPDATISMLARNPAVAAHFTNIPFLFSELDAPYIHTVLDGFEAFGGPFSSPLAFATSEFMQENPLVLSVFIAAYNDAVAMLNLEPAKAAEILAPEFKQSADTMTRWLTWPGMTFTSLPYGIMGWHDFMLEAGYIRKAPRLLADICSPQLLAWIGLEGGGGKNPVQKLQDRG